MTVKYDKLWILLIKNKMKKGELMNRIITIAMDIEPDDIDVSDSVTFVWEIK